MFGLRHRNFKLCVVFLIMHLKNYSNTEIQFVILFSAFSSNLPVLTGYQWFDLDNFSHRLFQLSTKKVKYAYFLHDFLPYIYFSMFL